MTALLDLLKERSRATIEDLREVITTLPEADGEAAHAALTAAIDRGEVTVAKGEFFYIGSREAMARQRAEFEAQRSRGVGDAELEAYGAALTDPADRAAWRTVTLLSSVDPAPAAVEPEAETETEAPAPPPAETDPQAALDAMVSTSRPTPPVQPDVDPLVTRTMLAVYTRGGVTKQAVRNAAGLDAARVINRCLDTGLAVVAKSALRLTEDPARREEVVVTRAVVAYLLDNDALRVDTLRAAVRTREPNFENAETLLNAALSHLRATGTVTVHDGEVRLSDVARDKKRATPTDLPWTLPAPSAAVLVSSDPRAEILLRLLDAGTLPEAGVTEAAPEVISALLAPPRVVVYRDGRYQLNQLPVPVDSLRRVLATITRQGAYRVDPVAIPDAVAWLGREGLVTVADTGTVTLTRELLAVPVSFAGVDEYTPPAPTAVTGELVPAKQTSAAVDVSEDSLVAALVRELAELTGTTREIRGELFRMRSTALRGAGDLPDPDAEGLLTEEELDAVREVAAVLGQYSKGLTVTEIRTNKIGKRWKPLTAAALENGWKLGAFRPTPKLQQGCQWKLADPLLAGFRTKDEFNAAVEARRLAGRNRNKTKEEANV
ncbi:hypothetical protein BST28_17490 [Mycolicibacter kumamotonensis]|uniref:Uncharacterized protein n=1 Tax=Mycolicibacter kumamotonensis TaxID=354243 RepID=A0A1X0DYR9_9MYCO|nr:hypothetical protein [Mycolicibacter kumamotonensis]ORA77596.1 hypothetical protein BST28_17490 [Mycolicibacter kumamotonensis]